MNNPIPLAPNERRGALHVPHVVAGKLIEDCDQEQRSSGGSFWTPRLDLNALVLPHGQLPPSYNLPVTEIIDFLVEVGKKLDYDTNSWLQHAAEATVAVNPLPRFVIENIYRDVTMYFKRDILEFEAERTVGIKYLDDWSEVVDFTGRKVRVRAFPARLVQILAGNSPGVSATSITRTALSKSYSLMKLPSNDLFTATAILRTMAEVDPDHPVVRSFSAVYWRGGDAAVESIIYRPQYFDKIIVWGGEAAVKNVVKYLGPGIEMVAFDPKMSISLIGRESHASEDSLREAVLRAAEDVQLVNQEGCACSRFQFVEGTPEEIDRYCEALCQEIHKDRRYGSAKAAPPPEEVRAELDMLRQFEPEYKVWGEHDGSGMVIRSETPVSFHPIGKVVNVVPVSNIADGIAFVTPATQTVGVWPSQRKVEVRDRLCAAGTQRVVALGDAGKMYPGLPHDGFLPLQRFVKWVADEG